MSSLRVLLHAPTADSLARARRNARNLVKVHDDAQVRIVANGAAVAVALAEPDPVADSWLHLCRNSLIAQGLDNTAGHEEVEAAVVALAEWQAEGWAYIHA